MLVPVIIYFESISAMTIPTNISIGELKLDKATISPTIYKIRQTAPAEPILGSDITLFRISLLPFTINPSEKSANASV